MSNTNEKDIVYITGHKHPDTDSVVSAIAYAGFKQAQGINAVPCRLGSLNPETSYLLKRFETYSPMLFKNARATLDEIDMDEPIRIKSETTIYEALKLIQNNGRQTLAVVNDRDQLLGVVTSSNLAQVAMGDTALAISLLKKTPVEYITKTVKGKLVYSPDQFRFNGKVSVVAIAATKLENYELTDRLVIIGNDTDAQLSAIQKGASCIIAVWTKSIAPIVLEEAREHGCAVIISGHGTMNTSRYLYFSPPVKLIMTTDLVCFNKGEFVDEVGKRMLKTRFRSYPVIDDQNRIYGFVARYHILNSRNKKVIMVDHNEYSQSVDGIEVADLIEVIDHHRISDITTQRPIVFRNEIIGSTASIITSIYRENGIEIPKKLAGLLLGAIISDTMKFRSPTTTQKDCDLADALAEIAELDIDDFAKDIFTVSSTIKNKSIEEIINNDIKEFSLEGKKVMVGQIMLYQLEEVKDIEPQLDAALDEYAKNQGLDCIVLVFTSVVDNGSIFYSGGALKKVVLDAFPNQKGEQHSFFKEVVSRKNQIIPRLSVAFAENN